MDEPIRTDHQGRGGYSMAPAHRYLNDGKTLDRGLRLIAKAADLDRYTKEEACTRAVSVQPAVADGGE